MEKEKKKVKEVKIYKEPNKTEEETTINVLYEENVLSIYSFFTLRYFWMIF